MNLDTNKSEWHYLSGVEVRGPLSLQEIGSMVASHTLTDTVMIATKDSGKWRSWKEVQNEIRSTQTAGSHLPPLPDASSESRPPMERQHGWFEQIGEKLNLMTDTEKLEGFSLGEMFSETFQKRTTQEMEEYFIVGTERTTPKISEVQTSWPKPWLFMRLLFFFVVLYSGFVIAYEQFQNANLVPGLILMGSCAMPLATLILFFELNTPRNVSIYRLAVLVGLGGIVSLSISLIGYKIGHLDWLGASAAGIIEELGKLAALLLIVRGTRYKYILNGMLFGAAVGAGFAAFESAGYAFRFFVGDGMSLMLTTLWWRALLAPFGHVAWTAMVGAAIWRVKGAGPVTIDVLKNPRFYRVLLLAMALHMLWDCPFDPPFYLKYAVLGAVGWFVIWGLVQQGLRQVRAEQRESEAANPQSSTIIPQAASK